MNRSEAMIKAEDFELIYGEGLGDNRRVPQKVRKAHDIRRLSQMHHEIIGMKLLGMRNKEIARRTGMTPVAISLILNSTLARRKLRQLRLARDAESFEAQRKIQELTEKALKLYDEILSSEDENVSLSLKKSTADVIVKDLSGLKAPTRVEGVHLTGRLSDEAVSRITERGIATARELGIVVDAVDAEIIESDDGTEDKSNGNRE